MKHVFHKIASITMAFVVLFSTMSFTLDMHYCGDTLVDTAIFSDAQSCGMEILDDSSDYNFPVLKKKCCSEEKIIIDGETELYLTFEDLSFQQQVFITSYIYSFIYLSDGIDENNSLFRDYSPPLVVKDIQLLDELFLI